MMLDSRFVVWLLSLGCIAVPVIQSYSPTMMPFALPPDPSVTEGMTPDLSYCQMLLELPVLPPADQVPWYCMCSTCPKNKGQKGERGDRGLIGNPGYPGLRGLTGPSGPPGFIGHQGLKGEKGDQGLKGDGGPMGPRGSKGEPGLKGDKGEPGFDGPAGSPGPKGDDGQCPKFCEDVPGPAGEPGLPGPVGSPGIPGLNGDPGARGLKGDPGIAGIPGNPGTPGQKGEQGLKGNCTCQNGTKGDLGLPGAKGQKGEVGETGQQGVQGKTGLKGDQGDMGMMGMPGPCSPLVQSAFSAALNSIFPPPNLPVVFERIIYNLQQHYNPSTGIYMAPVNGTYTFSYHLAVSNRALKVGLFCNYQPIVKSTEQNLQGSSSQQVMLHLSEGDRVWLQVRDSSTNGMFTGPESSSTFSGYLLYPDNCDMMMGREAQLPPPPLPEEAYSWGTLPGPNSTPPTPTP